MFFRYAPSPMEMLLMSQSPRRVRCVGRLVLAGAVLGGSAVGLGIPQPAMAQNGAVPAVDRSGDAQLAYETGLLLHREGEYEAAIGQYIEAIGLDPSLDRAYAALTDAQVTGAQARLALAIESADAGDLLRAAEHARRAAQLDGENADAIAAAASLGAVEEVLAEAQRAPYAQGQQLASELQWKLAAERFVSVVEASPMFLPARAALHRAAYFQSRSEAMANAGIAMLQSRRLGPAVEQLSGAVAIWPYHPDAAALLEQAQAGIEEASDQAMRAQRAASAGDLAEAAQLAESALETDSSNQPARHVLRDAQRGLADGEVARGERELTEMDYRAARARFEQAMGYVNHYPPARRGLAQSFLQQGEALESAERPGAALLAYLAGRAHDRSAVDDRLAQAEDRMLAGMEASITLEIPAYEPAVGVDSQTLWAELATQPLPPYMIRSAPDAERYAVRVQILDTDIQLRRLESTGSYFNSSYGYTSGYTRWQKRGTVVCRVTVTDRATGQAVAQWNASRWVTYDDQQQYVVGRTWRRSYFTLPTDEEIAGRLARDLTDEVWPGIREAVVLARARTLRDQGAVFAEDGDMESALEREVSATLLAAQVNPRQGERALLRLAETFADHAVE